MTGIHPSEHHIQPRRILPSVHLKGVWCTIPWSGVSHPWLSPANTSCRQVVQPPGDLCCCSKAPKAGTPRQSRHRLDGLGQCIRNSDSAPATLLEDWCTTACRVSRRLMPHSPRLAAACLTLAKWTQRLTQGSARYGRGA